MDLQHKYRQYPVRGSILEHGFQGKALKSEVEGL